VQLQFKSTYPVDKRENYSTNKNFLAPALGTLMCACYDFKRNIFSICLEPKNLTFPYLCRSETLFLWCCCVVVGGGGATEKKKNGQVFELEIGIEDEKKKIKAKFRLDI